MSEFRRRLLMQNALKGSGGDLPFDYVKDGLVFHLDGINRGSDPTAWTDLAQGIKFTYNDCVVNPNNVEFYGTSYAITDTVFNSPQEESTIEVCFEDGGRYRGWMPIVRNSPNNIVLSLLLNDDPQAVICSTVQNSKAKFYLKRKNKLYTISAAFGYGISNKEDITIMEGGGLAKTADNMTIGGQTLNGKIFSIRIYTRKLSKEEMLHNQQVDIDRFFGGVTPQ